MKCVFCFVILTTITVTNGSVMGDQKKVLSIGDQIQQVNRGDSTTGGFHVFEFHKGSTDMIIKFLLFAAIVALAYLWIKRRFKKSRGRYTQHHPMMGQVAQALTQVVEAQRLGPAYPLSVLPRRADRHEDEDYEEEEPSRRRS